MVLVLNGVLQDECPLDTTSLFLQHPVYRDHANQLLSIPIRSVGPVGLLYVDQREMAAVAPHDKNVNIIGSDDATSCIIVVVRQSGSGAVALAHLDGSGTDEACTTMISRVQELSMGYPEGRIELQLIGGFRDPKGYAEDLFSNIMQSFHKQPLEVDLTQACIVDLNTIVRNERNWPIVYGVGVNIRNGEIFPATFPDKGPELSLRQARSFTGAQNVLDIYDSTLGMLRIGPFNYDPLRGVDLWLAQSDDFLLQHLSTSPDVEPPTFVMHLRQTLRFIQDNQFPAVTVFPDNRPHYYRRDESTGCWTLVRY